MTPASRYKTDTHIIVASDSSEIIERTTRIIQKLGRTITVNEYILIDVVRSILEEAPGTTAEVSVDSGIERYIRILPSGNYIGPEKIGNGDIKTVDGRDYRCSVYDPLPKGAFQFDLLVAGGSPKKRGSSPPLDESDEAVIFSVLTNFQRVRQDYRARTGSFAY